MQTNAEVRNVFEQYLQRRAPLAAAFLPELLELRGALEGCALFAELCLIRTSLLFVYDSRGALDGGTGRAMVRIIDLPKVHLAGASPTKGGATRTLTHRKSWAPGNHEDGYLNGLDNIIGIFEEMVANPSAGPERPGLAEGSLIKRYSEYDADKRASSKNLLSSQASSHAAVS